MCDPHNQRICNLRAVTEVMSCRRCKLQYLDTTATGLEAVSASLPLFCDVEAKLIEEERISACVIRTK